MTLQELQQKRYELIESIEDPVERAKALFEDVSTTQSIMVAALTDLSETLKEDNRAITDPDLTDVGFFCRELENLLDDLRKDAKSRKELVGRVLCLHALENDGDEDVIRGQYARAECDMTMEPVMPKVDSPEYRTLLQSMGVDITNRDSHTLRISWKAMIDLLTERAQNGEQMPEGLLNQRPNHFAKFVRSNSNS